MKIKLTAIGLLTISLLFSGCASTGEEDQTTTEMVEQTTVAPVETVAQISETAAPETTTASPVAEDVYDNAPEEVNADEVEVVSMNSDIDDAAMEEAMLSFLDPFYYNVFFGQGNYVDGIQEEDMTKFAISYIYQHEYNELKFDTTDFILYVPEDRVGELVIKYFDYEVTGHHSFVEDGVMYEDGYYLMPAVDTVWPETMTMESIRETGDFSYEVVIKISDEVTGIETLKQVSVAVTDNRYVLIGYLDVTPDPTAPEETTEASE